MQFSNTFHSTQREPRARCSFTALRSIRLAPIALALLACHATSVFAADTSADIEAVRQQIEQLRAEQQRRIAEIQQQTEANILALTNQLNRIEGKPQVASVPAAPAPAPALAAAPQVAATAEAPRLKVSGDIRVRGQHDRSDDDGHERNSSSVRARLGATYKVSDLVTIGGRLVTGDSNDPNSTDIGLTKWDDKWQVSLDQAYVQLNFDDLKVYGGKMPQPFVRTELVWDGDVNPQGVAATYKLPLSHGGAFKANGLYFLIDEQAAGSESTMAGAQFGYDTAAIGNWKFDFAGAYYRYDLDSLAGADAGDYRSNLRNPDGTYLSNFHLLDFIAGASYSGFGERWPVRAVADYVKNLGARTTADTGYGIDVIAGRASKVGDWRVGYGFAVAETDAVLAAFSHDNTGIATNYRQHLLSADYVISPNTLINATWAHYKPYHEIDAGSNAANDWLDRFRLALLVNF
jgi:hypothetical protein